MKEIKKQMAELGLRFGREMLKFALLSLVFVGLEIGMYFFLGGSYYLLLPLIGWIFFVYLYFSRYARTILKRQQQRMDEFVSLFTFFGIYVEDGFTVFRALGALQEFASDDLQGKIGQLLEDIEQDKSVEPYAQFASFFPDVAVKQVMVSVYQMVEEGQGGLYVAQFNRLFQKLSDQKHVLEKEKRLERLQTLSFLPLAGSAISMITLSLTLLQVMEETMNVL